MPDTSPRRHREIVIVGGGFSGLGTAIALRKAGFDDLLIVDDGDGPAGAVEVEGQDVIHSFDNPIKSSGGMHILKGNIAPKVGVVPDMNITAIAHIVMVMVLPARWMVAHKGMAKSATSSETFFLALRSVTGMVAADDCVPMAVT